MHTAPPYVQNVHFQYSWSKEEVPDRERRLEISSESVIRARELQRSGTFFSFFTEAKEALLVVSNTAAMICSIVF